MRRQKTFMTQSELIGCASEESQAHGDLWREHESVRRQRAVSLCDHQTSPPTHTGDSSTSSLFSSQEDAFPPPILKDRKKTYEDEETKTDQSSGGSEAETKSNVNATTPTQNIDAMDDELEDMFQDLNGDESSEWGSDSESVRGSASDDESGELEHGDEAEPVHIRSHDEESGDNKNDKPEPIASLAEQMKLVRRKLKIAQLIIERNRLRRALTAADNADGKGNDDTHEDHDCDEDDVKLASLIASTRAQIEIAFSDSTFQKQSQSQMENAELLAQIRNLKDKARSNAETVWRLQNELEESKQCVERYETTLKQRDVRWQKNAIEAIFKQKKHGLQRMSLRWDGTSPALKGLNQRHILQQEVIEQNERMRDTMSRQIPMIMKVLEKRGYQIDPKSAECVKR